MAVQISHIVCFVIVCRWDIYLSFTRYASRVYPALESEDNTVSVLDRLGYTVIRWTWNWPAYIYIISSEFSVSCNRKL